MTIFFTGDENFYRRNIFADEKFYHTQKITSKIFGSKFRSVNNISKCFTKHLFGRKLQIFVQSKIFYRQKFLPDKVYGGF